MNMNVSSLPSDYASELKYYVETLGGGLLTTGGENTYALGGFKDTLYSELLPVEVEPNANNPRAIVICVDISNSMFMKDVEGNQLYSKPGPKEGKEGTRIDIARKGIIRSIDEGINPYDYIGIVVFGRNKKDINDTEMVLDLTPATHKEEIKAAVNSIQRKSEEGSTNYDEALTIAKSMLDTCPYEVNKKSVVLINDYDGNNDECETFETTIKDMIDPSNGENVINFSTIVVGNGKSSNVLKIEQITGSENVHMASNDEEFKEVVFDLCKSLPSDIYNYVNGVITPSLEITPITKGLNSFPEVESYNGTSAKSGAEVSVYYHNTNKKLDEDNEYVILDNNDPIYAQWNYGLGKVGSAMIDFSTKGCSQLFVLDDGKIFVTNVLNSLYSNYNLTENEIRISVEKDNYNSSLNISILNNDDVNLKGEVITPFNEKEILELINVYDIDYIGSIETLTPGIYVLKVDKTDNNGKVLSSSISYVAFSYSKEYDTFYNMKDVLDCLSKLTSSTGGNVYYSTDDITLNIKEMSSIHIDMNLQLTLMIIALVLFLLDIASRKFNFLFPHEIIAKYKNKER